MNATVSIHTGRVEVAAPFQNQYVVSTETAVVTATALESGSGRRGGHIGGGAYMPGATVVVAIIDNSSDHATRVALPNIILGALNPYPTFDDTEFKETAFVPDSEADAIRNKVWETILKSEVKQPNSEAVILNENRGANRPLDAVPGDWFKSNVLGGRVLLSEFMAQIGSSPDNALTFNGTDQLAEFISKNFSADHGTAFRELLHRGQVATDVDRFALNLQESMGAGTSPAFVSAEDPDKPWLLRPSAYDHQTGFFRREQFRCGATEGIWDVIRTDLQDRENHIFGEQIYPGVISEMRRMDGIYRLRAAKEIRFEKTYAIVTPWQKQELRNAPPPETSLDETEATESGAEPIPLQSDTQQLKDTFRLESEDDVHRLLPLLYDQFASHEEANIFFQGLQKDEGIWYLPTKEEVGEEVFGEEATEPLRVLDPTEREYTSEDLTSKEVEIYPGRIVKLFKNSSIFLMSEDGGFLLGDGYGGEIRMNRGRVTISSAADIEILPGRDLIEQVPGNRINRTQERIEFSTTNGSAVIKAEGNLQLVSGGESGGVTTIENRSPEGNLSEIDENALIQGSPFGAGIILKSVQAGVSIFGSHIYGGAYSPGSSEGSKKGVEAKELTCNIMLDAGAGNMVLNGENATIAMRSSLSMTMLENVTGMYIKDNEMFQIAEAGMSLVTTFLTVDRGLGSVSRPLLQAAKINTSRKDQIPQADPIVEINGSLRTKGAIQAKGQIATEKGVVSNDGANPKPQEDPSLRLRIDLATPDQGFAKQYKAGADASAAVTRSMYELMVAKGVTTERGQRITSFAFPSSDSTAYRANNFEFVAPRWQSILSDNARPWQERAVAHAILGDTYPYPGRANFESDEALVVQTADGVKKQSLNTYKSNLT